MLKTPQKTLSSLIEFSHTLEGLKKIERFRGQAFWKKYPQPKKYESVADHSWRLAMLVLVFANTFSRRIRVDRALKMALVHDLPEILCGDASPLGNGTGKNTFAFNAKKRQEKAQTELHAAKKLFSQLPKKVGKEFFAIWQEYEHQKTFESRIVKALDKIEASMQVWEYQRGHMFPEHVDFSEKYVNQFMSVDPTLQHIADEIFTKMHKNFRPFRSQKKK